MGSYVSVIIIIPQLNGSSFFQMNNKKIQILNMISKIYLFLFFPDALYWHQTALFGECGNPIPGFELLHWDQLWMVGS
jgi:hypothetical protein